MVCMGGVVHDKGEQIGAYSSLNIPTRMEMSLDQISSKLTDFKQRTVRSEQMMLTYLIRCETKMHDKVFMYVNRER